MIRHDIFLLIALSAGLAQAARDDMVFTIAIPQPGSHILHVTLRCDRLKGELQDFKMPVWSPGYYGIGDYARNVSNFRVEDGAGRALPFEKTARNTWRVVTGNSPAVVLNYDVFGATAFAANTYVGEDRVYLSPSGVFVYVEGQLQHPVMVTIQLPSNWKHIATGLEPVKGKPGVFSAGNFDVLYDCPILMGNQEYLQFAVRGVPHYVAIENVKEDVDRSKMVADLKATVTAATELIGGVPYRHYTFLMMGRGAGGIEHSNSSSNQFDGNSLSTPNGYLRWLSFICHEYFHNFNVKRIRPLALGPFDYEQENLTNMLWVSEGLSVYYEDLVLVRAGLMTRAQYLDKLAAAIGSFENASGHHYQSATESSWNTWGTGSGIAGDRNTTISYYNNGAMLGAMLDLKIRDGSQNRKSLDDVMRTLYRKYYLAKRRGFTDAEFRQECETAAGGDLREVFDYAATTKEVNYAKYFALAGLKLDSTEAPAPGAYLGLDTHTHELPPSAMPVGRGGGAGRGGGGRGRGAVPATQLVVTDVAAGSPAESAGIRIGDQILEVQGAAATTVLLNDALAARKAGDTIKLRISRSGSEQEVQPTLAGNVKKTYSLSPGGTATSAQSAVLNQWLRVAH